MRDKSVIITGATAGIGRAAALKLAALGADVVRPAGGGVLSPAPGWGVFRLPTSGEDLPIVGVNALPDAELTTVTGVGHISVIREGQATLRAVHGRS